MRYSVPILLVTMSMLGVGCMRTSVNQGAAGARTDSGAVAMPTSTPTAPAVGLGQEDPRLEWSVVVGRPLGNVLTSSVQVLPGGNVPTDPSSKLLRPAQTT